MCKIWITCVIRSLKLDNRCDSVSYKGNLSSSNLCLKAGFVQHLLYNAKLVTKLDIVINVMSYYKWVIVCYNVKPWVRSPLQF